MLWDSLGGICHGLNLSQIVKWTFKQHTIVLWSGFERSGLQILASQLFVFPHWGISSYGLYCLSSRVEFHVSKTVFKTCFGIGTCNSRKLKLRTPAAPIFKNCNDLLWFTKTLLFQKYISYVHTFDTSPVERPLLKVFPGVDKKQRCKRRKGIIIHDRYFWNSNVFENGCIDTQISPLFRRLNLYLFNMKVVLFIERNEEGFW